MRFRYTFTSESDTKKPQHTVRGELDRDDEERALKSAAHFGLKDRPRGLWRSWVVVVERLDADERADIDREADRFSPNGEPIEAS